MNGMVPLPDGQSAGTDAVATHVVWKPLVAPVELTTPVTCAPKAVTVGLHDASSMVTVMVATSPMTSAHEFGTAAAGMGAVLSTTIGSTSPPLYPLSAV